MQRGRAAGRRGQGLVEYAVILALLVVAVVVALAALPGPVSSAFNGAASALRVPGSGQAAATPTPSPSPTPTSTDAGADAGPGGVTVTPVVSSNSPWFNEEDLTVTNTAALTSLSITITVRVTAGLSYNGEYDTVGGQVSQSYTTGSTITYQFTLSRQSVPPGTYTFAAQTNGSGTNHSTTADTYVVTYQTRGSTYTQSGHF